MKPCAAISAPISVMFCANGPCRRGYTRKGFIVDGATRKRPLPAGVHRSFLTAAL